MGYLLLWCECLAASLLLVATVLAATARRGRWTARVVSLPTALLPMVFFAIATWGAGMLEFEARLQIGLFYPFLAMTLCYLVGAIVLLATGLRRGVGEAPRPKASLWPRARLVTALLVAVALNLMTFSNLDSAVKQQLTTLRVEAGALSLSSAPARVADRDNAALVYLQAFDAMPADGEWPEAYVQWDIALGAQEDEALDLQDPQLVAFLDEQQSTFHLLRKAAERPGCYFDREYGQPSVEMLLPELQQLLQAAQMLALKSRYHVDRNEITEALTDTAAIFAMAEHTGGDSILAGALVSMAIDGVAIRSLEQVLDRRHPTTDQLDALHLDGSLVFSRRLARTFRMEEAFGLSVFSEMAGQRGLSYIQAIGGVEPNPSLDSMGPFFRVFLLERDVQAYRSILGQYKQYSPLPYFESKDKIDKIHARLEHDSGGGILTALFVPALDACIESTARSDAWHQAARVALAMHRYWIAHGRFPQQLDELTPDHLFFVPRDPFDGQPLRFKTTDNGWMIYSIGVDQKDDGGAKFDRVPRTGDVVFEYHSPEPDH